MLRARWSGFRPVAFTLVELLIAIAIVAVLIAIVAPSLAGSRESTRTVLCGVNARSHAQAIGVYATDHRGVMPPAYVVSDPGAARAVWGRPQGGDSAFAYIHWSFMVEAEGAVMAEKAFECPSAPSGGAPALYPRADDPKAVEPWQAGYVAGNRSVDFQPARLAYTCNGALMPPGTMLDHFRRRALLVDQAAVGQPERVVLTTEFLDDVTVGWEAISEGNGVSRSHRPIMPFIGGSTGAYDMYDEPQLGGEPRFFYPTLPSFMSLEQLRLMNEFLGVTNVITSNAVTSINAVGRRHAPRAGAYGGLANFAFVDGHVERMSPRESLNRRLWGDRFWSISGNNAVDPVQRVEP